MSVSVGRFDVERGLLGSVAQYAAFVSGEGFTAFPTSVHPVLSAAANTLSCSGASQADLDEAARFVPKLIGSGVFADAPMLGLQMSARLLREVYTSISEDDELVEKALRSVEQWLMCPCPTHEEACAGVLPDVATRARFDAAGGESGQMSGLVAALAPLVMGCLATRDDQRLDDVLRVVLRRDRVGVDVPFRVLFTDYGRANAAAIGVVTWWTAWSLRRGVSCAEVLLRIGEVFSDITGHAWERCDLSKMEWLALAGVSADVRAGQDVSLPAPQLPAVFNGNAREGLMFTFEQVVGERCVHPALVRLADMVASAGQVRVVFEQAERLVGTVPAHGGPVMDVRLAWWLLGRVRQFAPDDADTQSLMGTLDMYRSLRDVTEGELKAATGALVGYVTNRGGENGAVLLGQREGAFFVVLSTVLTMLQAAAHMQAHTAGGHECSMTWEATASALTNAITAVACLVGQDDAADLFVTFLDEYWAAAGLRPWVGLMQSDWDAMAKVVEDA